MRPTGDIAIQLGIRQDGEERRGVARFPRFEDEPRGDELGRSFGKARYRVRSAAKAPSIVA
ncbi:MAG: hypothetical protein NVSMB19_06190 [Vulcanimicrobiaceae bacterium]